MHKKYTVLVILIFTIFLHMNVSYAESNYTITIDNSSIDWSNALEIRSENGEIMIPLKHLSIAMGGLQTNLSRFGMSYNVFALNDKFIGVVNGLDYYFACDLKYINETDNSMSYDINAQDSVRIEKLGYNITEIDGDVYFPLSKFCEGFDIKYELKNNNINFNSNTYIYYGNILTGQRILDFDISITNKVYDGKPIAIDTAFLKASCGGQDITDYMPLTYEYVGRSIEYDGEVYYGHNPPTAAGVYTLTIKTNANDKNYTGVGYFPFMIEPAKLTFTADNKSIVQGDALPEFTYHVSGIVDGERKGDVIITEPLLSVYVIDTSISGNYDINITDGSVNSNYTIAERNNATLTIIDFVNKDSAENPENPNDKYDTENQQDLEDNNMDDSYYESGKFDTEMTTQLQIIHNAYISGYPDNTFIPDGTIKRSEAAAMLYTLLGEPDMSYLSKSFYDVPDNAWYSKAINTLSGLGLLNGYNDGTFKPDNSITRAEFTALAMRYAGIGVSSQKYKFADVPADHWANGYIQAAVSRGIVSGYSDKRFAPEQNITRAEAVAILNRVSERRTCIVSDVFSKQFTDVNKNHWAYKDIMTAANNHTHVVNIYN